MLFMQTKISFKSFKYSIVLLKIDGTYYPFVYWKNILNIGRFDIHFYS